VAYLNYDGLDWEAGCDCLTVGVAQSKTSKLKVVALVAGATRHEDWFLDWGDFLALQKGEAVYQQTDPVWLLPDLRGATTPGKP
jgi:hypothetical protein